MSVGCDRLASCTWYHRPVELLRGGFYGMLQYYLSHVLLVSAIAVMVFITPTGVVNARLSSVRPHYTSWTITDTSLARLVQEPEPSLMGLIGTLLSRYATWLMLIMCSSTLALLGAAAIAAQMRRIAGNDDDR